MALDLEEPSGRGHLRPRRQSRRRAHRALALLLLAGLGMPAAPQDSRTGEVAAVPAQATTYRPEVRGYARVDPIQTLTIKAGLEGVIADLTVRPGQSLSSGEVVAHLGGPDQKRAIADAQAQLSAAQKVFAAARDAERAVQGTYRLKLGDRPQLDQAREDLANAEARVAEAKAALVRLQSSSTIVSPVSGRVLSLSAANGDRVPRDGPVLALQPDHDLWLQAIFYEAPAGLLTPGRRARFRPAGREQEVPVLLAEVLPSLRPDGGLTAFFDAAEPAAGWQGGATGEVVVEGEPRAGVAVPNAALILDRGRWWVLEKVPGGLRRQRVEPGPTRGGRTLVRRGLAAGDEVVVRDAYLLFHRDFGAHYTPPD